MGFLAELRARIKVDGADAARRDLESVKAGTGEAAATFTRLGAAIAAAGVAQKAFQAAVDYDSLVRGLSTVATAADPVTAQLARLREVAKAPGLGFKEAIQGSIRLQAAGLSARLAERSLSAFGNAIASVGGGKAELDGVTLALSQIASKGKLSAEEINQLAERVPQIRQAMNRAFGTTDTQAIEKMGLTAEDAIGRIVRKRAGQSRRRPEQQNPRAARTDWRGDF
jgi:tape measure domain-containing protein